jgi:hypothetical protein
LRSGSQRGQQDKKTCGSFHACLPTKQCAKGIVSPHGLGGKPEIAGGMC